MVRSGVVISAGYLLTGMFIKGYCGINAIKTGTSISHLPGLYRVGNFPKGSTINFDRNISDTFRISYGFGCCQMRRYIAAICSRGADSRFLETV